MKVIKVDDIIIENRQRREFKEEALVELSESIQKKGLIHAIVLRDDEKTLVAGERRFRAIKLLYELEIPIYYEGQQVPFHTIPFTTMGDLSPDDLFEAELEENILREDLTWQEKTEAYAKLHALRTKENPTQSFTATAREIANENETVSGVSLAVRESVLLHEHLTDPDIAKAKTRKEALKVLKKKKEAEMTRVLAEQFEVSKTQHQFYHGDFRQYSHTIPTSSVDVVLTDPPYGVGADTFGEQGGSGHEYEDSPEYFKEIIDAFIIEACRVCQSKAHLYLFCDLSNFFDLTKKLEYYGWTVWGVPIIWNKGNGILPQPDFAPRRTYECILYAYRGGRTILKVMPDVISIPGIQKPNFGAEKPVEVFQNLLTRSCRPGDVVWDPFAGAGPIFPAANRQKVIVYGTELLEDKYNFAKLRLEEDLV